MNDDKKSMKTVDDVLKVMQISSTLDAKLFNENLKADLSLKTFSNLIDSDLFSENPSYYKENNIVMDYIKKLSKYLRSSQALSLSGEESPFVFLKLHIKGENSIGEIKNIDGFFLRGFEGKYASSSDVVNQFLYKFNEATNYSFKIPNFSKYTKSNFSSNGQRQSLPVESIFKASLPKVGVIIEVLGEGMYKFKDDQLFIYKETRMNNSEFNLLFFTNEKMTNKLNDKIEILRKKKQFEMYDINRVWSLL